MQTDKFDNLAGSLDEKISELAKLKGIALSVEDLAYLRRSTPEDDFYRRLEERFSLKLTLHSLGHRSKVPTPCLLQLKSGGFVVLLAYSRKYLELLDFTAPTGSSFVRVNSKFLKKHVFPTALEIDKSLSQIASERFGRRNQRHWFWNRVYKEKPGFLKVLLATFFANLLATVSSLYTLQVYDRVLPSQSLETMWVLLVATLGCILFEAIFRVIRSTLVDQAGREVEKNASQDLLERTLEIRMGKGAPPAGFIAQALTDFSAIREFFTEIAAGAVMDIPFSVIFLVLIFLIAGPVVYVPVLGILLICLPPLIFRARLVRQTQDSSSVRSTTGRCVTEVSYGLEAIKSANAAPFFSRQWREILELSGDETSQQRRFTGLLGQWSATAQQIAFTGTISTCVLLVLQNEVSVGAIIATSILTSRALNPAVRLSAILVRYHQAKLALENLDGIVSAQSENSVNSGKLRRSVFRGSFEVQAAKVQYVEEGRSAVQISRLEIKEGERLALIGKNGSGKSTLLKLLSGLILSDEGSVFLDGIDLKQIDITDIRKNVGLLSAEVRLFKGTLRDNIAFGDPAYTDDNILEAAKLSGLEDFLRIHPEGLEFEIADGGVGLSTGQRQSVGLARLIVTNPRIVLLDEPTANFDSKLENEVVQNIHSWIANRTLVVATHRAAILRIVDRIVVLNEGRVVADDAAEIIMAPKSKKGVKEVNKKAGTGSQAQSVQMEVTYGS